VIARRNHAALTCAALASATAGSAVAEDEPPQPLFSDTQLIQRSGWHFEEPGVRDKDTRHMLTFQHFDAWAYGRNFFFFDVTLPWDRAGDVAEIYGEAYSSLSLSALSKRSVSAGPVKDVLITMGLNAGAATNGAGPLVFLPGASLDFDVPGFTVASVDVLAFIDRGRFAGDDAGCNGVAMDVTATWLRPWRVGALAGTVEGYVELMTGHGLCATSVLAQPQLRIDVGRLFDRPHRLFLGFELEVWLAKYGIEGLDEYVPRSIVAWRF
jgi:nucleoside-specific outer membrane channel protein Tsx